MITRWLLSRFKRAGFFVVLAAALGFLFALAVSAQRSARMHAVMGLAIESEKPGSAAWTDDVGDVASDDEDGDPNEASPPRDPDTAVAHGDPSGQRLPRIAALEPEAPDLASEDDPP